MYCLLEKETTNFRERNVSEPQKHFLLVTVVGDVQQGLENQSWTDL